MNAVSLVRTNTVNCFTGSISASLKHQNNLDVSEFMIFAYGCGFQLSAGLDQHKFPELIFDAITSTRISIEKFGGRLCEETFSRTEDGLEDLKQQVASGVVPTVWVNSRYLDYCSFYNPDIDYIHALALIGYDKESDTFSLFDPLIIDRYPMCCFATLSAKTLFKSLCDNTSFREYAPDVGTMCHVSVARDLVIPNDLRAEVLRQARTIRDTPSLWNSVDNFREACRGHFDMVDPAGERAGRRMFDHINTYFVLPSLFQLSQALEMAGFSERARGAIGPLKDGWSEAALLSLRYDKTGDIAVTKKIDTIFSRLDRQMKDLWEVILDENGK